MFVGFVDCPSIELSIRFVVGAYGFALIRQGQSGWRRRCSCRARLGRCRVRVERLPEVHDSHDSTRWARPPSRKAASRSGNAAP